MIQEYHFKQLDISNQTVLVHFPLLFISYLKYDNNVEVVILLGQAVTACSLFIPLSHPFC
jgi:hypothetical protein